MLLGHGHLRATSQCVTHCPVTSAGLFYPLGIFHGTLAPQRITQMSEMWNACSAKPELMYG